MDFSGKTVFITGGSRGIGLAIALKLAENGANIAIAAKTAEPHPTLPGTIYTAAEEIEKAGGQALPLVCDIRFEDQVEDAVSRTAEKFGGIDILINNASAIFLSGTAHTPMKRFDLMNSVNARGTYMCSQKALPYLKQSNHGHILNMSPPLDMQAKWFKNHAAYTMAKYGMSMCVLGMAAEFSSDNIGVNALWPLTTIDTAAIRNTFSDKMAARSRKPDIVADAAFSILKRNPKECTGNFFIDELVLREDGMTDFSTYNNSDDNELIADFFLPDSVFEKTDTKLIHPAG